MQYLNLDETRPETWKGDFKITGGYFFYEWELCSIFFFLLNKASTFSLNYAFHTYRLTRLTGNENFLP